MAVISFDFPAPTDPWSTNQERTKHWSWRNARAKEWKSVAGWTAVAIRLHKQNLGPSVVSMEIPFRVNRRRDPHNYVGTVVKAVVDGLVSVGVWPDDTAEFVTVEEPTLVVGETVTVTIRSR